MAQTHSLTAYKCSFDYLSRNNPNVTSELRNKIKNGEKPEYTLSSFINDHIGVISSPTVGRNAERAIQLTQISTKTLLFDNTTRFYLQPKAGKQGEPITVVEGKTKREYKYNEDDAALYDYNVFLYECGENIVAIFHRKSNAGCKSVFLETANDALRSKGMKIEMELIVPLKQTCDLQNATASKVVIQWLEPKKKSSDKADNLDDEGKKKEKKKVVRKLIIDLKSNMNSPIKTIIDNLRNGNIDENTAFANIKAKYLGEDNRDNYNDALIKFKLGKRILPPVRFGEIENQIGSYDITNKLNLSDFINSLIKNADKYYQKIAEENF
jgi:hypothetical protein